MQALDQSGGRGVEKFVPDAINPPTLGGTHVLPFTIAGDFFQRNSVPRAAPGRHNYIRIFLQHCFRGRLRSRSTYELTACRFD
jgi:hypothetical protein